MAIFDHWGMGFMGQMSPRSKKFSSRSGATMARRSGSGGFDRGIASYPASRETSSDFLRFKAYAFRQIATVESPEVGSTFSAHLKTGVRKL